MRTILALTALLSLTACNTTKMMEIPVVTAVSPVEVTTGQKLATIAFEKAIANIRRGTVIAHFPNQLSTNFNTFLCNHSYYGQSTIEWGSGNRFLSNWDGEFGQVFYDAMTSSGYEVLGNPSQVFLNVDDRLSADYLIAAKVLDVKGNFCEEHDFWYGLPQGRFAGELYLKVDWTVYAPTQRETVSTFQTEGYSRREKATQQGIMQSYLDAFESATENLANTEDFYALISGAKDAAAAVVKADYPLLELKGVPLSKETVNKSAETLKAGTVTIRRGRSHGSGFVISHDGHILTNHHVVGNAAKVLVILTNGLEIEGNVIRADKTRDIALLKVPLKGLTPLPIGDSATVSPLDNVVAVGSPYKESLKATITKGIVSALRPDETTKQPLIQSDVDIAGGSSGGPLVNANANVVGVSVAGYGVEKMSSGLNLFVPINEALESINVKVSPHQMR